MIANQVKGRGFGGTVAYVLGKDGAERIGGNMLGENTQELTAEFSESRKLKPLVHRAVYHTSLSLPAGERLSNDKWNAVAGRYLNEMGFQGSQYLVVRHTDTPHDHIHLVASRIRMTDGSVVSESRDYQRSEGVLRGIEKDYGLTRVTPSREVEHRAPSHGELELARKGIPSTRLRLQGLVDGAIHDRPTMTTFLGRMEASQVSVIPNQAKAGHISGVTFLLEGEPMKGSDLGRGYTWAGLQKRGVSYEHDRDSQAVSRAKEFGERAWTHASGARARGGTNGERKISGTSHREDHPGGQPPDRAAVGSHRHPEPGVPAEHGGPRAHEQAHAGGASGRAGEIQAGHGRTQGGDPGLHVQGHHDPDSHSRPHRSAERIRVLKNAAASLRRQGGHGGRHSLAPSSTGVFRTEPGPAEKGHPAPVFKSKALESLEREIAALEQHEREEERERQRKLQKERELGQKMDRSRGMGFSR
jgi:hypothetical protein